MASESGVLPIAEESIVRKWRLQPGKMLLIDLEQGRIIEDEEIKRDLAEAAPYEEWLKQTQYKLEELPAVVEGAEDRKSVVSGKSVAVRVDLGGRRIIKKKK